MRHGYRIEEVQNSSGDSHDENHGSCTIGPASRTRSACMILKERLNQRPRSEGRRGFRGHVCLVCLRGDGPSPTARCRRPTLLGETNTAWGGEPEQEGNRNKENQVHSTRVSLESKRIITLQTLCGCRAKKNSPAGAHIDYRTERQSETVTHTPVLSSAHASAH